MSAGPGGLTSREVQALVHAAKHWATFQQPDSLEDQKHNVVLQNEAIEAREQLLTLIEALP